MKPSTNRVALFSALPTFPQDAPLAWAAACGALSAIGLCWNWVALARLLAGIALLELVCRWVSWLLSQGGPKRARKSKLVVQPPALPYASTGSPAQRTAHAFARVGRSWRAFAPQPSGPWARTLLLVVLTGLLLCSGMGAPAMGLGLLGLFAAAFCGLWLRTASVAADVWAPAFFTALAWALGALAAGGEWSFALAAAVAFGLAASGVAALRHEKAWGKALLWAGLALPAAILIAFRLALPAAAVLFIAMPACILSARSVESLGGLVRMVRPLLLISMAVVAVSLSL